MSEGDSALLSRIFQYGLGRTRWHRRAYDRGDLSRDARSSLSSLSTALDENWDKRLNFVEVDDALMPAVEAARPGYSPMAIRYLSEGHNGLAVVDENGNVLAMGWTFLNNRPRKIRVKGYFYVKPKEAYLHAAWTAPESRGRGLQSLLIRKRGEQAFDAGAEQLVANIDHDNIASSKAYRRGGFNMRHTLQVLSSPRRRQVRNLRVPLTMNRGRASHSGTNAAAPRVLLLDGTQPHTVPIARELHEILGAEVITASSTERSLSSRSRHVSSDVIVPLSSSPEYAEALCRIAEEVKPDVILPVGYFSTAAAVKLQELGTLAVPIAAPDLDSFTAGEDKTRTYAMAETVGISVPQTWTAAELTDTSSRDDIRFPLVAKLQHERGDSTVSVINDLDELHSHLAEHSKEPYLYQEFVEGEGTYAHCGYFVDGEPLMEFQHFEQRSVPRVGGSGTRLHSIDDAALREQSRSLLKALHWTGLAQVEFKRNGDQLVLMEINPKLWASYALASRAGAPLASMAVAHTLCTPTPLLPKSRQKKRKTHMVFPLRELKYLHTAADKSERLPSLKAMLWPPARPDVDLCDLRGYIHRL